MVTHWPRFPREAVAAPSLAVSKARLDGALSNLVYWKVSLPMAGGWNQMICKIPSNPHHSVILPKVRITKLFCICCRLFTSVDSTCTIRNALHWVFPRLKLSALQKRNSIESK